MKNNLKRQIREILNPEGKERMLIYYVNPITGKQTLMNPKKRKHEANKKES
jgi:hypothetical protein